ncbi:MAG: three-Cys-motif partner protein TcmP [Gammaproteobacteria bacterium]|nr:three-Cys-motif partner protein TcmP [Gammaproteobacteria bacterium]
MNIEFGGQWTKIKLNILEKYLGFYTKALQNQIFTLHYADAFAGSGEQKFPGIDSQQDLLPREILDGTVRIALKTEPGFHKYHFNDLEHENVERIQEIANNEFPKKQVDCTQKDANKFVQEFCSSLGSRDRAVLFIDPFSTELQWETLKSVAESKKVDMWLLFPFSVILRLMPKIKLSLNGPV